QNLPYYRYDEYIDIPIIREEVVPEQAPINDDIPYLSLDGVKEYGAVLPPHQVFELKTASQVIEADTESKFGRS
ncbi:hypothetical protein NE593_11630, partial [Megasphaera massiliensis]|uniref:hypothetical protein n=1 Tax=Megasphaera massiliensis TaxID=1232428 RepID=UPI00210E5D2C